MKNRMWVGLAGALAMTAQAQSIRVEHEPMAMSTAIMACTTQGKKGECDKAMRNIASQAAERMKKHAPNAAAQCDRAAREMISMDIAHKCHNQALQFEQEQDNNVEPRVTSQKREITSECNAIAQWVGGNDAQDLARECVRNALALITSSPHEIDPRPVFEAECKAIEEIMDKTMGTKKLNECERAVARAWIENSDPETVTRWERRYRAFVCTNLIEIEDTGEETNKNEEQWTNAVTRCMRMLELGR